MRLAILALFLQLVPTATRAADVDPAAVQFFESKIRPVLVDRCYSCHSTQSKKLKAELYVDSLAGLLRGGESGPSLVAGHPEQSRLIEAISYKNVDLQMPPKDKLSDQQIADLTKWVKQGAVWRAEKSVVATGPAAVPAFDLAKRKADHWAWQPVKPSAPPAVQQQAWVREPVDAFILAGLEAKQLHPAPPADRRTLLRRVTFDLTGLPPTAQETATFLDDESSDALAKVVDRLLASARFGERWGRHWLDLARYAETLGHEFDFVLPNAWRYRDYVIRAFNHDVPYNQFVLEQIAGDLLPTPRRNPLDGSNESVIGTGFQYLGESVHSPVDVRQNQADLIDNRIDVTGKAILGMTVACARCHDHKFDAIAAADYYGMYGMFESTRYAQRSINDDEISGKLAELCAVRARLRRAVAATWGPQAASISKHLLAARRVMAGEAEPAVAATTGVNPGTLAKWVTALKAPAVSTPTHPAYAWIKLASGKPQSAVSSERLAGVHTEVTSVRSSARPGDIELADFSHGTFGDWNADGVGFGNGPSLAGDFILGTTPQRAVTAIVTGGAVSSGVISDRLEGSLRSPSFTIERQFLFVHASGHETRINVCVEGLNIIRAPIYGGIKRVLKKGEKATWVTFDLSMWKGRRAYIEFTDSTVPDPGDTNSYGPGGAITVDRVVASDDRKPPVFAEPFTGELVLAGPAIVTVEALADRYQRAATEAIDAFANDSLAAAPEGAARASLLNWLVEHALLDGSESPSPAVAAPFGEAQQLERALPAPQYVPGAADGNGIDARVFIRGSHKNLGPVVPRRLLEALGGKAPPAEVKGSGRLQVARQMVDPANPLTSRVIVNRVWHHLFGRGLVASADNFGLLGEKPSHPELLDTLADRFVKEGWSIKRLIRELVLTNTYQMASRGEAAADEADPENRLLHRANLRRLEGEAIRDEMLAISGRLNLAMGGPGVNVNLTPFMEGRGRPASGPLDGDGRRSIYLGVRRNFLSPMLLAFDTPIPFSAMGRRSISNVPAQALILMNDPFVVEQSRLWSEHVLAEHLSPADRVVRMYTTAFCRPPTPVETNAALAFVDQQAAARSTQGTQKPDDPRAWTDLAHVLMNLKEFIFIN